MKPILATIFIFVALAGLACSSKHGTQDAFTKDSNYYDYEYYGDTNLDKDTTFSPVYDYYYIEDDRDIIYQYAEEPKASDKSSYPPVELQERPKKAADRWFFDEY